MKQQRSERSQIIGREIFKYLPQMFSWILLSPDVTFFGQIQLGLRKFRKYAHIRVCRHIFI